MTDFERFNADGLALSAHYAETMGKVVLPFLDAARRIIPVEGTGGRPLYVERYDARDARGTVAVIHGFTENTYKFSEIVYSLLQNRFSVLAYDHRGHGRSWRDPAVGDRSLTHVDRFDEYVADLRVVVDRALADMPGPWSVFCHSMGGAVTGLYLERYPETFSRAAMCAPMIAPDVGPFPSVVARVLCTAATLTGNGRRRAPSSKPYSGPEDFETFPASGRERFDWYDAAKAANPDFQNNGPSYGWVLEAMRVTKALLAPGAPEKIAVPVLLCTAALDTTVRPQEQERFISRVPQGRHVRVEGTKHEIYRATDEVLFPWWHMVLEFLEEE